jgi:hypothetical protein
VKNASVTVALAVPDDYFILLRRWEISLPRERHKLPGNNLTERVDLIQVCWEGINDVN